MWINSLFLVSLSRRFLFLLSFTYFCLFSFILPSLSSHNFFTCRRCRRQTGASNIGLSAVICVVLVRTKPREREVPLRHTPVLSSLGAPPPYLTANVILCVVFNFRGISILTSHFESFPSFLWRRLAMSQGLAHEQRPHKEPGAPLRSH